MKKSTRAAASAVFLFVGIGLIIYAFSQQCDSERLEMKMKGQFMDSSAETEFAEQSGGNFTPPSMEINIPRPIEIGICIFTNPSTLISLLLGLAFVPGGAKGLVKAVTEKD